MAASETQPVAVPTRPDAAFVAEFLKYLGSAGSTLDDLFDEANGGHWDAGRVLSYLPGSGVVFYQANGRKSGVLSCAGFRGHHAYMFFSDSEAQLGWGTAVHSQFTVEAVKRVIDRGVTLRRATYCAIRP